MKPPFDRSAALPAPPSFRVADSIFASFLFAWQGISYAFVTQRNFRIQTLIGGIALGLTIYLELPPTHGLFVCLAIVAVLTMELLNTALEAVVDLTVGKNFHAQAKIAKDCAAGAVLISASGSLVIAATLLLPPLLNRLGW